MGKICYIYMYGAFPSNFYSYHSYHTNDCFPFHQSHTNNHFWNVPQSYFPCHHLDKSHDNNQHILFLRTYFYLNLNHDCVYLYLNHNCVYLNIDHDNVDLNHDCVHLNINHDVDLNHDCVYLNLNNDCVYLNQIVLYPWYQNSICLDNCN